MAVRLLAVIPARLDSRRLPSKHLRPLRRRPMVAYTLAAMRAVSGVDEVVVATSDRAIDDPLAEWAEAYGVACYRGDVDDVLGRVAAAAAAHGADLVIKANGDSPLLAPEVAARGVAQLTERGLDLASGKTGYTGLPQGFGVEVLRAPALARLAAEAREPDDRESITGAAFAAELGFDWAPIRVPAAWCAPDIDLCVDTHFDRIRLEAVLSRLPEDEALTWPADAVLAAARAALADLDPAPDAASLSGPVPEAARL